MEKSWNGRGSAQEEEITFVGIKEISMYFGKLGGKRKIGFK